MGSAGGSGHSPVVPKASSLQEPTRSTALVFLPPSSLRSHGPLSGPVSRLSPLQGLLIWPTLGPPPNPCQSSFLPEALANLKVAASKGQPLTVLLCRSRMFTELSMLSGEQTDSPPTVSILAWSNPLPPQKSSSSRWHGTGKPEGQKEQSGACCKPR